MTGNLTIVKGWGWMTTENALAGRTVPGLVQRLARRNTATLARALEDAGMDDLPPAQALLLPVIGRDERAARVAERAGVARQTVAQAIAGLERSGYVERDEDPDDARAKLVLLTRRGREAIAVVRAAGVAEQRRWAKILGPERLADLREHLLDLLEAD